MDNEITLKRALPYGTKEVSIKMITTSFGAVSNKKKGEKIIDDIKFLNVPVALQNVYTNTENIHDENIAQSIARFIEERMLTNTDKVP